MEERSLRNEVDGISGGVIAIEGSIGHLSAIERTAAERASACLDVEEQVATGVWESLIEIDPEVALTVHSTLPHLDKIGRGVEGGEGSIACNAETDSHGRVPRAAVGRGHVESNTRNAVARDIGDHRSRIDDLVVLASVHPISVERDVGIGFRTISHRKGVTLGLHHPRHAEECHEQKTFKKFTHKLIFCWLVI